MYRGFLYYKPKEPEKDWELKCRIEEVLRIHPSYGSRRLAIELKLNRKRVKRVMNLFGVKAYRRQGKRWKKTKNIKVIYPNLLLGTCPSYPNHISHVGELIEAVHQQIAYYNNRRIHTALKMPPVSYRQLEKQTMALAIVSHPLNH